MNVYVTYLINIIKILFWRIKYRDRLKIHPLQLFEGKVKLKILKNGFVVLNKGIKNREGLFIVVEGGNLTIGKNCFFNINCSITCLDKIEIGNNCSFANNIVIVDHDHNYKKVTGEQYVTSNVIIGNNVWIGANSTILRGTVIGDNCVIAAGSIVKGNIESDTLYYQRRTTEKSLIIKS